MPRILMISKACLVGTYQTKLTELAAQADIELGVIVPPVWHDRAGPVVLERAYTEGYKLWVDELRWNGRYHFYYFPTLQRRLAEFRPDICHIDEEPYNFATWHAMRLANNYHCRTLFFTWQNINRQYPIPFRWLEQQVLRQADYALMGNQAAVDVFQAKGYTGRFRVIPQFGVSPTLFVPPEQREAGPVIIGYAGRLVEEKGIDLLLQAAADLHHTGLSDWHIQIAGRGPQEAELRSLARSLGIANRTHFLGAIPSAEMPAFLQQLHILVLPSQTQPNWKEQFGRILIEAMACETAVIGSDSGEIPHVIGDAGHIFPEGDLQALANHLKAYVQNPDLRRAAGQAGRQRVLANYTQSQVAAQTAAVYNEMMEAAR